MKRKSNARPKLTQIAVFTSGDGTNLQALIDAVQSGKVPGEIVLVLASKPTARSLLRAQEAGLPTLVLEAKDYPSHDAYSAALARECKGRGIDLICLAGFMHIVSRPLVEPFRNRILNLHPALIPAFSGHGMFGMNVHQAVVRMGVKITGPTIHFVDEGLDTGPIIAQYTTPVHPDDTPDSLATRVRDIEHQAFPEVVKLFCEGRIKVSGRVVRILPPAK